MLDNRISLICAQWSATTSVVVWCGVVMGVAVVLGSILLLLRRRYGPGSAADDQRMSFSIDRLEEMRDSGDISEQEFKTLRSMTLKLDKGAADEENASSSEGGARDDEEEAGG